MSTARHVRECPGCGTPRSYTRRSSLVRATRENRVCRSCATEAACDLDRFMQYVEPEPMSGCWLWTAADTEHGYGQFWYGGQMTHAHRAGWEILVGEIPDGLWVLHRCDVPPCVNPDHLYVGTASDNARDRAKRNPDSFLRGERHQNSKLTREQVRTIRNSDLSTRALARRYGVVVSTVKHIRSRRAWRHL